MFTMLAVVCWTTGPVGAKAALLAEEGGRRLTPLEVAFWPIALAWLVMLGVMVGRGRLGLLGEVSGRGWLVLGAMGVFGWVGYQVALNFAYTRLALANALIIGNLAPVFVTAFQGRMFGRVVRAMSGWEQASEKRGERSIARVAAGLVLCLVGVAVIATEGRVWELGAIRSVEGAAAALFGAVAWGVYSNLGRFVGMGRGDGRRACRDMRALQWQEASSCRTGNMGDVQNFGAMTCGLAIMGSWLWWGGGLRWPGGYETELYLGGLGPVGVSAVWVMVVMGVVNYAAGYTAWLHGLEEGHRAGEAHKLPPLTYLLLVLAVVGGWLVLHEAPGSGFWQGAALIAAGNAVNLWRRR